jgi:hypothetical protein
MWGLLGLAIALTFSLAGWIVRLVVRGVAGFGGGRGAASFVARYPMEFVAAGVLALLLAHVVFGDQIGLM